MTVLARPAGGAPISRTLKPTTKSVKLDGLRGAVSIDLSPLRDCPALTSLTIDGSFSAPDGLDLSPLRDCPALTDLTIDSNHLGAVDLSGLTALTTLRLRAEQPTDLAPLADMPLRHLTVICQEWPSCDLSALSKTDGLRRLTVTLGTFRTLDISPLSGHTQLEKLDISATQLRSLDLTPLARLPRLRELTLAYNRWLKASLDPLADCPIRYLNCTRAPRLTLSASLGEVPLLRGLHGSLKRPG